MIEYTKKDDDSSIIKAYDFDNDNIIQSIDLNDWNDIQQTLLDDNVINNETISASSYYYTASMKNDNVKFNFFINQKQKQDVPSPPHHNDITSNILSIDFWLLYFPWRSSTNSYLALLSTVCSSGTTDTLTSSQQSIYYQLINTMDNAIANGDIITNDPTNTKNSKKSNINIIFCDPSTTDDSETSSSLLVAIGTYQWPNIASTFYQDDNTNPNTDETTVSALFNNNNNNNNVDETNNNVNNTNTVSVIATSSSNQYDDELTIAYSFISNDKAGAVHTVYWEPQIGIIYKSLSDPILNISYNEMNNAAHVTSSNENPDDAFFGVFNDTATSSSSAVLFLSSMYYNDYNHHIGFTTLYYVMMISFSFICFMTI